MIIRALFGTVTSAIIVTFMFSGQANAAGLNLPIVGDPVAGTVQALDNPLQPVARPSSGIIDPAVQAVDGTVALPAEKQTVPAPVPVAANIAGPVGSSVSQPPISTSAAPPSSETIKDFTGMVGLGGNAMAASIPQQQSLAGFINDISSALTSALAHAGIHASSMSLTVLMTAVFMVISAIFPLKRLFLELACRIGLQRPGFGKIMLPPPKPAQA